jgi:crotonobetainyl-CoA:carnitine CoA-transferase CaiB-like acyl-CoA transferase
MDRPELAHDERYATHVERGARMEDVDELVSAWTSTLSFDALDSILQAAAVPHGLIYRAPDMIADPQFLARETIQRVHDPALGRDVAMPRVVPRLSRTPGCIRWAGADVGAHTDEVLAELGLIRDKPRTQADKGAVSPPG